MEQAKYTFTAPAAANLSFKTITLKETNGDDEKIATNYASAKGAKQFEELVKLSIFAIDGKEVTQPFEVFDKWPTKDRTYVGQAFNKINGSAEELIANFLSNPQMEVKIQ